MKISNLMTKDVVTCRHVDTLERAAQLMWEHDVGCLPVVDEQGHAVGVITDRDACMAAYTRGAPLRAISVDVAMAHQLFACGPDDDVHAVEARMRLHQLHRMPVLDAQGHPIGIVSINDLARAASSPRASLPAAEVTATLAAICAPRPAATAPA